MAYLTVDQVDDFVEAVMRKTRRQDQARLQAEARTRAREREKTMNEIVAKDMRLAANEMEHQAECCKERKRLDDTCVELQTEYFTTTPSFSRERLHVLMQQGWHVTSGPDKHGSYNLRRVRFGERTKDAETV